MSIPDLTELRKDIANLPSDSERRELIRDLDALEKDCSRTDQLVNQLRDEHARAIKKQRKYLFLAIPFFGLSSYFILFNRLAKSIATGVAKGRNRDISATAEPLYYWFIVMFEAAVGCLLFAVTIWLVWRLVASNRSCNSAGCGAISRPR